MDGTDSQGTAFDLMDQIPHHAKVRVAGSNPVFHSNENSWPAQSVGCRPIPVMTNG